MTTRYATLSGKKLLDPLPELQGARANRTPTDFWLKANAFTCPIGKEPGRAYVLLTRRDLIALDRNALHSLVWTDAGATTTFVNLVIVRADCMNLLHASDPKACYLVELADCRQQLKLSCINAQYNIRIPAPPAASGTSLYYPDALNGGSLWTWQTMISDIWGELPAIAGAAPTLPYTPDGTPEGFRFIGVSTWDALHVVLDKIGCAVRYNPLTGELTIIRRGTTQSGLAAAQTALSGRKVYNYDPLDSARADSPETVRVFFHKRAEDGLGTERDTPRDDNWEMNAVYSGEDGTGITGAEAGTVLAVWDDLPALVDESGNVTNTSELALRVEEIAANIAAQYSVESPHRTHYAGCLTTILPGSEVSQVVWRDYSDGHGLVTEVHREAPEQPKCCGLMVAGESVAGPDLGRKSFPNYPDLAQHLVVYHDSASYGEFVQANSDGLHPGYIVRVAGDETTYLDRVWILFTDNFEFWAGQVLAVQEIQYGPGRLSGSYTSGGETYPLYRVTHGDRSWQAVNTEMLNQGEACEVEVYWFDSDAEAWGATGITWDAWDWFLNDGETIETPTKMLVKWEGPILVITNAYCTVTDDPVINPSSG